MGRLGDSELDQSEDSKLGIEHLPFLQDYTSVLLEKGVQVLDERRVKREERSVESLVEILQFGIILVAGDAFLELVKIARAHREEEAEILLFGRICLYEVIVGLAEIVFRLFDGTVVFGKLFGLLPNFTCRPSSLGIKAYGQEGNHGKKKCRRHGKDEIAVPVTVLHLLRRHRRREGSICPLSRPGSLLRGF